MRVFGEAENNFPVVMKYALQNVAEVNIYLLY
jgi:hypothetical protein